MSKSGKNGPRLVAEKRSRSAKKTKTVKRAAPARGPKPRRPRSNNPLVAFILGIVFGIVRVFWAVTWRATAVVALVVGLAVLYIYTTLPEVEQLLDGRSRGSVTMLDRNGEVYAWRGDQFGGVVTADLISPHLKHAVVATEDRRFYLHPGVDPIGIASAIRINLREGRGPFTGHGGSTLTQQTAKLLCLGVEYDKEKWKTEADYIEDCRQTTLWRKAKEAVYAMAMEVKYTKDEILTIYINRAYMGAGTFGAEAASQRYFGKSAANLKAQEAAILAGLLTAPSRLAPTNDLERSQNRAATVLRLMQQQGYLTEAEMEQARANPARLSEAAAAQAGGYFADWVMESGPELFTQDTTEDVIIKTTLDKRMQKAAEDALDHIFETKVSEGSDAQAAIVVMSADGAVRAMVGGRKSRVSGAFNRATMANRQTGSAFKPFVYATALELGYGPNATVVDEPYCIDVPGSGRYCPDNYDHKHRGRVTLTQALAQSLNVAAVKVSETVGRDKVRQVASDFGIKSDLAAGPALALGASESTLLEMTGAYAGILNGGSSVRPYGLVELKLRGDSEPLMDATGGIGERVIREDAAKQLVYMMTQVIEHGTGRRAKISGLEVAGKTGTTQAARDAWFVGFSADYVAGVWMGNDDNTPLKGVTGGGLPADIWRETMVRVHEGIEAKPLPMIEPAPPAPQPQAQQPRQRQPQHRQRRNDNPIENILRGIFGGG